MRKSLLKTIVATAVVGATMALSCVAAMAATYTMDLSELYDSSKDVSISEDTVTKDGFFTLLASTSVPKSYVNDGSGNATAVKLSGSIGTSSGVVSKAIAVTVTDDNKPVKISAKIKGGSSSGASELVIDYLDNNNKLKTLISGADFISGVVQNDYGSNSVVLDTAGTYYIGITNGKATYVYSLIAETNTTSTTKYTVAMGTDKETTYPTVTVKLDDQYSPSKVKLSWDANESFAAGSKDLTIVSSWLSGTEYTVPYGAVKDYFEELITASDIDSNVFLNFSELDAGDYTNGDVLGSNFTVVGSNKLTIDKSEKAYGNFIYTKRLKTNGNGSKTDRAIKFTLKNPAFVQVNGVSGSSDSARPCVISDGTNAVANVNFNKNSGNSLNSINATLSAGTYYIYATNGSVSLYSINIVMGASLDNATTASNGKIFSDKTNAYALASVAKSDLTANDKVYVTADGKKSQGSDTVYPTVVIGNNVFTASDLGFDYIYAVKLNNAVSANKLTEAKAYTKSFDAVAE